MPNENETPMIPDYWKELDITVSICDASGYIIYMNDKAINDTFADHGGVELIGTSLLDCHPEPSKSKLKKMMEEETSNTYFKGQGESRRLIHQTPIYHSNVYFGFMELIIPCPEVEPQT